MKKQTEYDFVDFSKFKVTHREVMVDGSKLPLAIGDKLRFSQEDRNVKTVMGIQIHEDGRVNYCLEWYDEADSSFKNEWLTLSELKLLQTNSIKKKTISLNG